MRVGVYLIGQATGRPAAAPIADPAFLVPFARHAEAAGFDSLFLADHIVFPAAKQAPYPYTASGAYPWDNEGIQLPEPLSVMAFLAGATTDLRLGTAVLVLPQRHPIVLAKQVATIDHLSGGRLELGIGAGWLRDEIEALGCPFESRGERTDEWIRVLRTLWREPVASHHGTHLAFDQLRLTTHPARPEGVPIIVGGHSQPARRRAGRLGDGFLPAFSVDDDPDGYRTMWADVLAHADAAGRAPGEVALHGFGSTRAGAEHLSELGAHRMIASVAEPDLDASRRALDRLATQVGDLMQPT